MISFGVFIGALVSNPVLLVITVLVIGTVFVNGATDASNAIATAIGTRSINPDAAIAMGAICNFIGLIVTTYLSTAVADTISKMVNFGGDGALCADGARLAQRTWDAWQCHNFRATDAGCVAVPPFSRVMQQMRGSATLFARGDGTLQNVQRQLHGVQRFARLQRSIVNALEEVSFRHQPKRTQVFGGHSPLSAIGSMPKKTLALSLLV